MSFFPILAVQGKTTVKKKKRSASCSSLKDYMLSLLSYFILWHFVKYEKPYLLSRLLHTAQNWPLHSGLEYTTFAQENNQWFLSDRQHHKTLKEIVDIDSPSELFQHFLFVISVYECSLRPQRRKNTRDFCAQITLDFWVSQKSISTIHWLVFWKIQI